MIVFSLCAIVMTVVYKKVYYRKVKEKKNNFFLELIGDSFHKENLRKRKRKIIIIIIFLITNINKCSFNHLLYQIICIFIYTSSSFIHK